MEYTLHSGLPPMPVARIYASLVEEAEPICADLLARGYNVEIVFPDAVLTNPADLELRVERCSAEQAIARVEAGGSPSRCVFVTPAKGPRRELLLVEMTVLATGTDGRHPMAMPGIALVADHLAAVPLVTAEVLNADTGLAEVLPFPVLPLDASAGEASGETAVPRGADVVQMEQAPSRGYEKEQNLNKNLIAELNAFLAHAPVVERPEGLHVRILENVRHSVSVERARKNWEGLTLAGIAASLVMLVALGWYAGPNRPRQVVSAALPTITVPQAVSALPSVDAANVKPVALATKNANVPLRLASERRRLVSRPLWREAQVQDDLIAQDHVVRATPLTKKLVSNRISGLTSSATTSELVRPAAVRTAPFRTAPVKIITDLK